MRLRAPAKPAARPHLRTTRGPEKPHRVEHWLVAVGAVALILGFYFWLTSARLLDTALELDYGPTEPHFASTLGSLIGSEFSGGNKIATLVDGDSIFPAMLDAIRGAKQTVTIETYIWSPGKLSDEFITALTERAQAGVKVLVIVDGMGTLKLHGSDYKPLTDAGGRFVRFGREHWYDIKANINHRTHRKILVVDGRIGFTGGMCIDDKWLGHAQSLEVWHDVAVRIEGPVVRQMQATFAANWMRTTGELLTGEDYFPVPAPAGGVSADVARSGPDDFAENARVAFLMAIASARKSIKIENAYFVPDELAQRMLVRARERGVDVSVVVPAKNDSDFGRAASRSRWGPLLEAGVKFYQYLPAMYHAKVMIIDDSFVTVGSVNFDNRSFAINDELNVNFLGGDSVEAQLGMFKGDVAKSTELTREVFESRPWWQKRIDWFCGLFRSQL